MKPTPKPNFIAAFKAKEAEKKAKRIARKK
jgi:hypothetical protein